MAAKVMTAPISHGDFHSVYWQGEYRNESVESV